MSDAEYMCYGYPDYSIKMSVYLIYTYKIII